MRELGEFVRGAPWWSDDGRPLRADPAERELLPGDTWERATVPAGVRLAFAARGVREVEIAYEGREPWETDGYRDVPPVFTLLSGDAVAGETPAAPGTHVARLELPHPEGEFTLHLPEALRPALREVRPVGGGTLTPAPPRPRWLVYGDSITEGWSASRPHLAWPALAGRALGLDTVNLGYAGAARGELASARQLGSLRGDFITLAFGTNCWSRTPSSAPLLYETTRAFLTLVRQGNPHAPVLVVSPVVRPEAEVTPNELGATLGDLRAAVERAARDADVPVLPGAELVRADQLVDGVHPSDAGHAALAAAVTATAREAGWTG
ncbi:GDSL-type esterase/lipase family protein [Streptomyces sp. NPDC059009]|uniref:GDSL-type esterase/lipase family protein n=1 Tax=Streptomyces sp. NPDC059009 TaxID=3346694 RepID=UPI00368D595E